MQFILTTAIVNCDGMCVWYYLCGPIEISFSLRPVLIAPSCKDHCHFVDEVCDFEFGDMGNCLIAT